MGWRGRARRGRLSPARAAGLIAALALGLGWGPSAARANSNFTWTGVSSTTEDWSSYENWEGEVAPTSSTAIGTLTFPRLTSTACTAEEENHPCYTSANDVPGLSAESIQIDDGDSYWIGGKELALGSGGITASPAGGASGPAGDFLAIPLRLTASQKWSVSDRSGGALEENGLLLDGDLTGPDSALTVEQSNGSALIFANHTEVGPVTVAGSNPSAKPDANGSVWLEGGELDSADQQPVNLSDILFIGTGALGSLTTNDVTLIVGSYGMPAEGLEASSVRLDPATGVIFQILGDGTVAQKDYSQLTSSGPVELAGLIIAMPLRSSSKAPCPVLTEGSTYTLVSTTGTLSGSFSNAPEDGPEVPIFFEESCHEPARTMRVRYNRNGDTKTVTATVEAAVEETQEATEREAKREEEAATTKQQEELIRKQEELIRKLVDEHAKQVAEEVVAGKNRELEVLAAKKLQEQAAMTAKGGVLGVKEVVSPRARTRAQLLAKALRACGKEKTKKKRAQCQARARKQYGSRRKSKSKRR